MSKVTNTIKQRARNAETGFNEVKISYIEPNGCAAEGTGTVASGKNQHVQGKWNIKDSSYAHIVGNGTDDSNRSNMHLVDWNGNVWYAGGLYLGDLDFQALNNVENALGNNKLVINGDINVTGKIKAGGTTLQMDKLYALTNKEESDTYTYYLYNRFKKDDNSKTMYIYPRKVNANDTAGEYASAVLGLLEGSFNNAYLDAFTMVGYEKDKDNSPIASEITSSRKVVYYNQDASGAKIAEEVNVLAMETDKPKDKNGNSTGSHNRFFIDNFFGVGAFDVYGDAHFQSSVSVSNTDLVGRAILSFRKDGDKKYLEISFADTDN